MFLLCLKIIKEWNAELQACTGKFRKQATAIAEWDKRILQNRDVLLRLEVKFIFMIPFCMNVIFFLTIKFRKHYFLYPLSVFKGKTKIVFTLLKR